MIAEEGGIADDDIDFRPVGFGAVVLHDGVHAADVVVEGFEDGFAVGEGGVTVILPPLDVADPDDDGGEVVGDGVDFDAVHLAGVDFGHGEGHASKEGVGDDLFFEIHEQLKGDIEKVAAATGGVEDADFAQGGEHGLAEGFELAGEGDALAGGGGGVELGAEGGGLLLDGLPLTAKGLHEDGFDDEEDVFAAGVVRAELGTLGGIEAALEECAEDGGFDGFPIEVGGTHELAEGFGGDFFDADIIKERPVEVRDALKEDIATVGHGLKKLLGVLDEAGGMGVGALDNFGEDAFGTVGGGGQEADIFGKEAEDEFGEEVGDAFGGGIEFAAHVGGDVVKDSGGVGGDLCGVAVGMEAFGVFETVAQEFEDGGFVGDVGIGEAVDALFGVGEVGMDFPCGDVGDDEEGRVAKLFTVTEQLLVGVGEVTVFAGGFVFDGEMAFVEDIGETLRTGVFLDAIFKGEDFAGRIDSVRTGAIMADKFTEFGEVQLIALAFAEGGVLPTLDEVLRCAGGVGHGAGFLGLHVISHNYNARGDGGASRWVGDETHDCCL